MDSEGERIYTLEDVAEALNLSKSTVSRAISGKGRIAGSTRERVHRFISTHDYRPSALARGLASRKTYNFAIMFPNDYQRTEILFFHDFLLGCVRAASEHNYDVLVSDCGNDEIGHIERLIRDRKVDGIIIPRATTNTSIQDFLIEKKVPYVVVGRPENTASSWVDFANRQATEELTEILLRNNVRPLALIGGKLSHKVNRDRERGYRDAFERMKIKPEEALIFTGVEKKEAMNRAVELIYRNKARGILCMDETLVYEIMTILRTRMIPVPQEIKVACCFDSPMFERYSPTITGIRFDTDVLSKKACEFLLQKIEQQQQFVEVIDRYQIVLRGSTQHE